MKVLPVFKALSDPTRLRIMNLLLNHELNVNEIVEILDIGQSGISRHLKILTDSELLKKRKDGLWSFFSAEKGNTKKTLIDILPSLLENEIQITADNKTAKKVLKQRTEKSIQLFDSLAPHWEQMKISLFGKTDINEIILSGIFNSVVCADLGCGTGDLIEGLIQKAKTVIGVDSSPQMIAHTRKRFAAESGKVEVRMGELEHLPLREGEADTAICNMVLHHLPEPLAGLVEINRILKPKGQLIIADFSGHTSEMMRSRYGDRWLGFQIKELQDWLVRAGFAIVDKKEIAITKELTVLVLSAGKQ
ncbi:MAG: ArsR family transcriptional regulator [Spirochaetales bacterium]|nr:ArsR family transcriptional regulator [Spirochaetales bacterium]